MPALVHERNWQGLLSNKSSNSTVPPRDHVDIRKHDFDGLVMELAVPQYMEGFISLLADRIHALPQEKRLVVVIPPYRPGFPSPEVTSTLIKLIV